MPLHFNLDQSSKPERQLQVGMVGVKFASIPGATPKVTSLLGALASPSAFLKPWVAAGKCLLDCGISYSAAG